MHTRVEIHRRDRYRNRRRYILIAVVATALALGVIGGLLFALARTGGEATAVVPDVEGLTYTEAQESLESAGLVIDVDPGQESRDRDLGRLKVEWQDPKPETRTDRETMVTVHLEGLQAKQEPLSDDSAPVDSSPDPAPQPVKPDLIAPMNGQPLYPFTRDESISCGHWPSGSQDYPYFGAPRDSNTRTHAGVDIYPPEGVGAPVKAMKDGTVLKVAPFYTRYTGEVTYALLVDHGDFVANYAELQPPSLQKGSVVKQGDILGNISGTVQLHFEMYSPGTVDWTRGWYGEKPSNLLDATSMMLQLYGM